MGVVGYDHEGVPRIVRIGERGEVKLCEAIVSGHDGSGDQRSDSVSDGGGSVGVLPVHSPSLTDE